MSSVPADDAEPGRGSDAWVADRCAALTPLASALTDTTATAAALLGASLARSKRRGGPPGSETERVRAQVATVYLGRSNAWADSPVEISPDVTDSTVGTLASLTRLQRVIWALREVEELTQAEIASILDRPPAVVARALTEAYATLDADADADTTLLRRRIVAQPDLADVRSAYRRAQRRRSRRTSRVRGLVVLGVLVLGAVIAIPTMVLPRLPVFVREAGEWTFMHTVTSPQGWEIRSRFLSPSSEGTLLRRTYGGAITCTAAIVLDSAQSTDVTPARSTDVDPTTQVRINGRPGTYDAAAVNGATLTWAVTEGVQARVICQAQTMQDLGESGRQSIVLIAESVRFHRTPVTMPYALTRLPDRYAVEALTTDSDDSTSLTLSAEDPEQSDVNLVVSYQNGASTNPQVRPRPVRVGDRDAVLSRDPNHPTLCFAPREASTPTTVCVAAYWPALRDGISPVPDAVIALLTETAASLTFASDTTDRSTWVDARTAIPR